MTHPSLILRLRSRSRVHAKSGGGQHHQRSKVDMAVMPIILRIEQAHQGAEPTRVVNTVMSYGGTQCVDMWKALPLFGPLVGTTCNIVLVRPSPQVRGRTFEAKGSNI